MNTDIVSAPQRSTIEESYGDENIMSSGKAGLPDDPRRGVLYVEELQDDEIECEERSAEELPQVSLNC